MSSIKKVDKNKNNKYIGKVDCPECKSINTIASSFSANSITVFVILMLTSGCCFWVPILGWVMAPVFAFAAVVSLICSILGAYTKTYTLTCKDCNSKYKIDKSEYNKIAKYKMNN